MSKEQFVVGSITTNLNEQQIKDIELNAIAQAKLVEKDRLFGMHIREAILIVKDWLKVRQQ
jgi:hypothetical protein